ncbi:MAG: aspartate aminotransferase family protein [Verrucomicrobiae bacterium]|nr:aspartate aminotransferase family protein [Verrucomicrobiae bacterium]
MSPRPCTTPSAELPELITRVPGPQSKRLARLLKRHEAPTVTFVSERAPVILERASGVNVWDADGNRFVDLASSFGVASLGHMNPAITRALRRQAWRLPHAMGDVHPGVLKGRLCRRLSKLTFERWSGGRTKGQVLLGNSGFEAVEAALKTARLFTRRRGVIAFEGSYHGLGYGALETTARPEFRTPFANQLGRFAAFAPYPRRRFPARDKVEETRQLQKMEKRLEELAARGGFGAVLVEPVQGRGGEVMPPPGFLPKLRAFCDRHRMLLIADEIYTGLWRTGRWFAVDHSGVIPDLICLGKALTGCLPLSACVGRRDVMVAWPESTGEAIHTSTFLGNPLACAAALASLEEFEKIGPSLRVEENGEELLVGLRDALRRANGVRDVRGLGYIFGIEMAPDAPLSPTATCARLLAKGLIALTSGPKNEVLALVPPLTAPRLLLNACFAQVAAVLRQ